MTYKQTGPVEVRPNTLRDQTPPNTFRTRPGMASPGGPTGPGGPSGPAGQGGPNRLRIGGGARSKRTPRPATVARPGLSRWTYMALALLAFLVVLYLLNGTP